ncbi:PREDICTED: glutamate receptor 2.7-like [Tarenaya hassleriana]|uniref:glutamate receptor 2.7-like n=1 Tax=Tarenaya hassleriana TaxID=28532 RepID=UPI00053C8B13|nr:PREDICTED: glutamate receptor 2.7-like [Tarenaya hassleriana]
MKILNPTTEPKSLAGSLALFFWCFSLMGVGFGQNSTREVKVGVVLDLRTTFSKICLASIHVSLSDFYANHPNYTTRLSLRIRDSNQDVFAASAAASDLIKNEQVIAIVGPQSSTQADFMIRLTKRSRVPIISFSATSPSLASIRSPYFVRATLSDSSQINAIVSVVKSFGWRNVVAVYVDDEFGEGIVPYLVDAFQDVNTRVAYRSMISPDASDDEILRELYKLMTMQTRVFVVHMFPSLGFRVFAKAREIGMMEDGYVWILTDAMTHLMRSNDRKNLENMKGVLGVRTHVPNSNQLEDFRIRWRKEYQKANPETDDAGLNVFALWAYDSVAALAMAVEKTSSMNLGVDGVNISGNGSDLGAFGVSRNGPTLMRSLSDTRYKGLTGEFNIINGELQPSVFEIINLNGNGVRVIGFWTHDKGLVKELDQRNGTMEHYSASNESLLAVTWPGESTSIPRGWEIPTNRKKLRVGVPMKGGFEEFMKVRYDPRTNSSIVSGYSKDVFEAVLRRLPYSVTPEYIPFKAPVENYTNHLVYQVFLEKFDAVVGDITIVANRTVYVDFTLPYTESGVSMLVPLRTNRDKNTWVFLKPWSWDLWVTSGCFFIFIGFAVWVLEHRVNEDFRGPPHHQIGTSFWFSFSTLVFAHRERVVSNLARFVVIVWCFVVLVLTQSYTASLTSLLTVQQFQPTVMNVNQLIKNGDYVGFLQGSFVHDILKNLGFGESKLRSFTSVEELEELFSNGRIAAAFDEVPYLKVFLSQYCSKYTTVETSFKTAGFSFVFPKGSPLTDDVSKAILEVNEGEEMRQIEKKWFKNQGNCSDPTTALSSNPLSLTSFWGLFLIAGVASFLAIVVFMAMFLYEQRHTWKQSNDAPQDSMWRKSAVLLRIFNEKDLKSHMFKKSENAQSVIAIETSPNTHCPPSPSTAQNTPWPQSPRSPSKDSNFSFFREGRTSSSLVLREEHFSTGAVEHDEDEYHVEIEVGDPTEREREMRNIIAEHIPAG